MDLFSYSALSGIFENVKYLWSLSWWFILPFLAFFAFLDFWLLFKRRLYIQGLKWQLLEIKVPENILKTPKAMEQIFAAFHAAYSFGIRFKDKYFKGRVEDWMSFELVSIDGNIHFYVRVPAKYRHLIESAVYAQYPDVEISMPPADYLEGMPKVLPDKVYDLFGSDLVLVKESPYPIRTYHYFEEKVEEQRIDPMAAIMEVMSKLKSDEQLWIQILIRPTGDAWKKEGEKIVDQLLGKEPESKARLFVDFYALFRDLVIAFIEHPQTPPEERPPKKEALSMLAVTPGKKEIIEEIEKKIAKIGFETTIRYIYIDRRDAFSRDHVAAVNGAFRQFNTLNLNSFRPNLKALTAVVKGFFKKYRVAYRKRLIYNKYRNLIMDLKPPVFNTEELATIYHFPITATKAPSLYKIKSKKAGPPENLPVE